MGLGVFWAERARVTDTYGTEVDVLIGRPLDGGLVDPLVAIDCKVELDASRLKTSIASFLLIKRH